VALALGLPDGPAWSAALTATYINKQQIGRSKTPTPFARRTQ